MLLNFRKFHSQIIWIFKDFLKTLENAAYYGTYEDTLASEILAKEN